MSHLKRSTSFSILFFLITILATGCGGGGDSSSSDNETTTPSFTASAGDGQITINETSATSRINALTDGCSYNVYMTSESGLTPESYESKADGAKHESVTFPHTISDLENGKTYYVIVTEVCGETETIVLNETAVTPVAPSDDSGSGGGGGSGGGSGGADPDPAPDPCPGSVLLDGLFADSALQNCVDTDFPAATCADEVTGQLHCVSEGISSLTGINNLTNITYITFLNNQIADVGPLSGLKSLTFLNLSKNEIANVGPLSGLSNLTTLGLDENQIADVQPLSGLTNLTNLWLMHNQIVNVGPLSGLTNLLDLYLKWNLVVDPTPLASLTTTLLHLAHNKDTLSCNGATFLIGVLGGNVDINNDGLGALDIPFNGVNCTNP